MRSECTRPKPCELDVVLHVNGTSRTLRVDPTVTLLDALRERLGLSGTKRGCDHRQCGACTVLVDGRAVSACLSLAIAAHCKTITTIEGLSAKTATLHPLQVSFITEDASQCGDCPSVHHPSAVTLLRKKSDRSRRSSLVGASSTTVDVHDHSSDLCRGEADPSVVQAIRGT